MFLLGDLNISLDDKRLTEFCNCLHLGHLIKTPTSYLSTNLSSIDRIITYKTSLFKKSCTIETVIGDYHKLIISICRTAFAKGKSKKFFYCGYKNFDSELFEETVIKSFYEMEHSLKSFGIAFYLNS